MLAAGHEPKIFRHERLVVFLNDIRIDVSDEKLGHTIQNGKQTPFESTRVNTCSPAATSLTVLTTMVLPSDTHTQLGSHEWFSIEHLNKQCIHSCARGGGGGGGEFNFECIFSLWIDAPAYVVSEFLANLVVVNRKITAHDLQ